MIVLNINYSNGTEAIPTIFFKSIVTDFRPASQSILKSADLNTMKNNDGPFC